MKEIFLKLIQKGYELSYFEEIDSTNTYLKSIASDSINNKVVIANTQTNGRGRLGRTFVSNKNSGIYMSILLKNNLTRELLKKITCLTCVAIALTIEELTNINTKIKWVNDIYINNKKVSGILTESKINNNTIEYIIVGIGLNLYKQDFGADLNNIATSIEDETGQRISKSKLISKILDNFINLINDFESENIYNQYKQRLFILNKEAIFQVGNNSFNAKIIDLNPDFSLRVLKENEIMNIDSGEITKVKINE